MPSGIRCCELVSYANSIVNRASVFGKTRLYSGVITHVEQLTPNAIVVRQSIVMCLPTNASTKVYL